MKKWFRNWLGHEGLEIRLIIIQSKLEGLHNILNKIDGRVSAFGPGLGRIIAKLDPRFGTAEDDPKRVAESKDLGEAVIKRLEAEDAARRHGEGKSI